MAHCESTEHAPTPQASASTDLVQVARNNTHNLTYLRELPARLLETVDVGLVTGTATLPVHSYVLMAYSPVFAEFLAGDTGLHVQTRLAIDASDDTRDRVRPVPPISVYVHQ